VGIGLVLAGAIFMTVFPAISEGTEFTGNLLLLIFLLADTGATLLAKKLVRQNIPTITLTNLGFIIGALTTVPLALVIIGPTNFLNQVTSLSPNYHLGVWYMALLSGTLAKRKGIIRVT
jgi:drug/metabolite transporter (DMT)-like permease